MGLFTCDVEPLWIARYDYQPGWRLPTHSHRNYFQLISIIAGEGEAFIGTRRVRFQTPHLFFLRPGLRHGLQTAPASTIRTLDTKFYIHRAGLRKACRKLEPVTTQGNWRVTALLEAMHAEAQQWGPFSNEVCQALLAQVLLALLRKESVGPATEVPLLDEQQDEGSDLCHQIQRFLRDNYTREINQRVFSKSLHYSYRHLHAVWRKRHQESPLQALWRYRVERAMQFIRYSDYELKHIVDLTGFASIHHFTRVFRRIAGMPPGRWRDLERRGIRRDIMIHPGFVNRSLTIQTSFRSLQDRGKRLGLSTSNIARFDKS